MTVTGTLVMGTTTVIGPNSEASQSEESSAGSATRNSAFSATSSAASTATMNAAVEVNPMFGLGAAGLLFAGLLAVG